MSTPNWYHNQAYLLLGDIWIRESAKRRHWHKPAPFRVGVLSEAFRIADLLMGGL